MHRAAATLKIVQWGNFNETLVARGRYPVLDALVAIACNFFLFFSPSTYQKVIFQSSFKDKRSTIRMDFQIKTYLGTYFTATTRFAWKFFKVDYRRFVGESFTQGGEKSLKMLTLRVLILLVASRQRLESILNRLTNVSRFSRRF